MRITEAIGSRMTGAQVSMAMKYVVTDDFVAAHGWTADKTAKALMEPLASIGVLVERVRGFGAGGFQAPGLTPDVFRMKKAEVIRIVGQVLKWHPLEPTPRLSHGLTRRTS